MVTTFTIGVIVGTDSGVAGGGVDSTAGTKVCEIGAVSAVGPQAIANIIAHGTPITNGDGQYPIFQV